MKVYFNTECYHLLLEHVPKNVRAYEALEAAAKVSGGIDTVDEFWVECTEPDGDVYCETARLHFRNRAREVEQAIVRAVR